MRLLAAILLLVAVAAPAGVVIRDNDVTEITGGPTTNTLTLTHGEKLTYRIASVQGTNVVPWNGATAVTGLLYDVRLGDLVARGTGVINSAAAGVFTVHFITPTILEPGPYYELQAVVYSLTGAVGTIAWDPATVAASESSGATINISNRFENITSEVINNYTSGVARLNLLTQDVQIAVTSGGTITTNGNTLELALTGSAQSPATNSIDLAGYQISNGAVRATGLHVGPSVYDGGTNNVALTGWATFGAGSHHNVSVGGGNTIQNTKENSLAVGTNVTIGGSYALGFGRDQSILANYSAGGGYQSTVGSGAQVAWAYGWANTNAGASYGTIGGGKRNYIGSSALSSIIPGGESNEVYGIGGIALGHSGIISSGATNAMIINLAGTRATNGTSGALTMNLPAGLRVTGGYYAEGLAGVTRTNLLLLSDGVSVYTQIIVKGVVIQ